VILSGLEVSLMEGFYIHVQFLNRDRAAPIF
jgi:hypothetical protein